MDTDIIIRFAKREDAQRLLDIYRPYVLETAISFEYEPPSLEEFVERLEKTSARYPYLVAERGGELLGYAYAGCLKPREAYDRAVETTIYLRRDCKGHGLGRRLYEALEDCLREQHITSLYACIGYPQAEDEYLTRNSAEFHRHLGFELVGHFHRCGYKFSRWYDMVWMEKLLTPCSDTPPEVLGIDAVKPIIAEKYKIF